MSRVKECEHFGIDSGKVRKFENRIDRLLRDMRKEGLYLFCGSVGTIRTNDKDYMGRSLVVGHISETNHDGGDGSCSEDDHGLLRGE